MQMSSHSVTTQGRRETNQDRACAIRTALGGQPATVLAVADGMGGMRDGDRAAELAIEEVRSFAGTVLPAVPLAAAPVREAMVQLFRRANSLVFEYGQRQGIQGSVGTTLVCAVVWEGAYLVANAGDSRAYYVNDFEARQITRDHSHVAGLVASGSMTPEAARRSPFRNQLTNSLGEPDEIDVDVFPAPAHVGVIDEACALVLCSDGLHGEMHDADLFAQLHGTKSLETAAENLLSLAFQRGSTDNITVAMVEAGGLARKGPRQPAQPPVELLRQHKDSPPSTAAPRRAGRRNRTAPALLLASALLLTAAAAAVFYDWRLPGTGVRVRELVLVGEPRRSSPQARVTDNSPATRESVAPATAASPAPHSPAQPAGVPEPAAEPAGHEPQPGQGAPAGAMAKAWQLHPRCRWDQRDLRCEWTPYPNPRAGARYRFSVSVDSSQKTAAAENPLLTTDRTEATWSAPNRLHASKVLVIVTAMDEEGVLLAKDTVSVAVPPSTGRR